MESYYKEKENISILNLKRPSQTIKNNDQILKTIKNKIYPLNSVHRSDLYFKQLKKQANKKTNHLHYYKKRQIRNSLKLITKPNQQREEDYLQNQMQIYKELIQQQKQHKKKHILKENIEELIKKQSQTSVNGAMANSNSQFKYQRLPKIKQEIQLKKAEFVHKIMKQMQEEFVDRDKRNYSFQYMVKKSQMYKKNSPHDRQMNSITVYQNQSPNKIKQYVQLFKENRIKKVGNTHIQSRKLIRLPNTEEQQKQSNKNLFMRKLKSKRSTKPIKNKVLIKTEDNQENTVISQPFSTYTSKIRVTQNRKKGIEMQNSKKSRSNIYQQRN